MTEAVTYSVGVLLLLAAPGPTNALLATSGAAKGFGVSLGLLSASLLGYLLAIALLRAVVGPVIAAAPALGVALSAVMCVYLLYLAWVLWRRSGTHLSDAQPITFQRVFLTTMLNPKAIVFAFSLFPLGFSGGEVGLLTWFGILSVLIILTGVLWIAVGAMLRRGMYGTAAAEAGYRGGAVVLMLFACVLGWRLIG
jgi:threonine/homoserine/homoserine lactone efflux protein